MPDRAHEETDKELKKLEARLTKEYRQAAKEVEKKLTDYLEKFAKKDAEMQKKVAAGLMSAEDYGKWRLGQMATGERWKEMQKTLTEDLVNVDKIAAGMINDSLPNAYAQNMNYGTYEMESGANIDTSFTLYDKSTVQNLMKKDPKIIPQAKVDIPKDQLWNRRKLTSAITQGILQGEAIPKIAKRLRSVADMDRKAAIRNARTYTTAAENKGRIDSYERAKEMGIPAKQQWMATLDDRTRVEHRHLDGQIREVGEDFETDGYKIKYPGDPSADPEMIYNCRCTLVAYFDKYGQNLERNESKLGDMTYDEWKNGRGYVKEDKEIPASEKKPIFEFVPAKTISEAEEYAKNFVDDSQFGALGISYKGVGLDVANEINHTIAEFYNKYNVDKFGGILVPKANSKNDKLIQGAHAGYSPIRNSFLVNRQCKGLDMIEKHLKEEKQTVKDFIEHPEWFNTGRMKKEVLEVLNNSAISGRGTVPENMKDIINHELGHSLEKQIKNADNIDKIMENMKEYAPKVSGYSVASFSEYIAESFCSYNRGEGIVDDELIKAFKSLER